MVHASGTMTSIITVRGSTCTPILKTVMPASNQLAELARMFSPRCSTAKALPTVTRLTIQANRIPAMPTMIVTRRLVLVTTGTSIPS